MNNFNYYAPTKVVFGKDTEKETGRLVKEQGASSVLVHFGGKSAIASGLIDRVCQSLKEEGIAYETLGGVVPNPRLSKVREGIALCREKKIDFILAVGGGSVIDSAKAIGYGVANEGDVWDFYAKKRVPTACLPIGAVLTIAAAGSEMSNSSVITNEDGGLKRGCNTDLCRCRFAVMNPELTYTLPDYQTQCGCTDIMMHTMERYFNMSENMELTDGISEALIKTVMKHSKILKERPERFAKFARNIFNIQETDDEKAAVAGIEAMENYYQSVGMPTSLCELGIHATEEQIKEMADKCSFYGKRTVGVMKKIGAPEAAEIYRMANDKSIPLYSR